MVDRAVRIPALIVDLLPRRLWKPANLHFGARLHFCIGPAVKDDQRTVRTVEWNGNELGQGRKPVTTVD